MRSSASVLERAILRTVAYSDVFDHAPATVEVHRYLDGTTAALEEVEHALDAMVPGPLVRDGSAVALAGRDGLFSIRRRRLEAATAMWPAAVRWGRALGRLPFARMVALTGGLAVDNVEPGSDLDYLVVTEPGRVWLCRWLAIQTVRLARLHGDVVCPNWLLAADALALTGHDLFTARNLTQMVPVAGTAVYHRMLQVNSWTRDWLPNAVGPPRPPVAAGPASGRWARLGEAALRSRLGSALEDWEQRRKTREILARCGSSPEVVLDHRQCKGHVDSHGRKVLRAYAERLQELSLEPEASSGST